MPQQPPSLVGIETIWHLEGLPGIHSSLLLSIFIYLKGRIKERKKERLIFHLLVHILNAYN